MEDNKWVIFWNECVSKTYLYGTKIIFHKKDHVEIRNQLMPSDTVIKTWYSKTNYQMERIEPSLPMIDGENKYEITVNMETEKPDAWLMRMVFYDRYENEAGTFLIRDKVSVFKCPIKTYSYQIQLINGGAETIHFHSIIIKDITNAE